MKTPEQIAESTVETFEPDDRMAVNADTLDYTFGYPLLKEMLVAAIRADRAQRTVTEAADAYKNGGFNSTVAAALYDALTDRETDAADAAAEWVAENEDGLLWDRFVGPLMDAIEKEVTR